MDANIYLFVGLMSTILGFSLIIYTIVLFIAHRRNAKRYVGNIDVVANRDWEANLQLTPSMTSTPTTTSSAVANPFEILTATAPTPVAPTPVAPPSVAPMPIAPPSVAPMPIAPPSVAPMPIAPPSVAPTSIAPPSVDMQHQQVLVALEQLVKQQQMGLVDDATYQQRKLELFAQLSTESKSISSTPKSTGLNIAKTYTSYEELVVDFTEGIITAKEFEQHKATFNQSASSS
jgi:hypothetical protein